jgi:hypothetical protein
VKRFGTFIIIAALAASCGGSKEEVAAESTTTPAKTTDARFEKLNELRSSASPEQVAAACDEHAVNDLPGELRERCASAHYDFARDLIEREEGKAARSALNRAREEGMPAHRISSTERDLKALEKKIELREGMAKREDAAHKVSNVFSYRGMEVRTQLGGEYKETITIEYAGLNGETAEQVRSDEFVMGPLREAGVKSVTLTDGSGYSTTVKLD